MKKYLFVFCLSCLPFVTMGQNFNIHAYGTTNPDHFVDHEGNVRTRDGGVLVPNGHLEIVSDGQVIKEALKLQKRLERQGENVNVVIHPVPPDNGFNGNSSSIGLEDVGIVNWKPVFPYNCDEVKQVGFTASYRSYPLKKRLQAVKKLVDHHRNGACQEQLKNIVRLAYANTAALDKNEERVVVAAIKGINDVGLLNRIRKDCLSLAMRRAAYERLERLNRNKHKQHYMKKLNEYPN